jgi:translation initiation factor IF-1
MTDETDIELDGLVADALPNQMYEIRLTNGEKVVAHIAQEARIATVRILPGDKVRVRLAAYNASRGRIIRRYE